MFLIKNLMTDESGATAIEYGLIVTLIAMAAVTAFQALGTSLSSRFETIGNCVEKPETDCD